MDTNNNDAGSNNKTYGVVFNQAGFYSWAAYRDKAEFESDELRKFRGKAVESGINPEQARQMCKSHNQPFLKDLSDSVY